MIRLAAPILLGLACALVGAGLTSKGSIAHAQRLHGRAVVVFDGSGSMFGKTKEGHSKIAVARIAANALISKLSAAPAVDVGLVVFGAQQDWQDTPREKACQDVVVAEPLGRSTPVSARRMQQAIDSISPRGQTPLGLAVDWAVKMLGAAGGSIVIVTDMEETCEAPGDPLHACQVLERTNRNRSPTERVYVNSIVLLPAPDINMATVERVRGCTGAKVLEAGTDTDARRIADAIAEQLKNPARRADEATARGHIFLLDRTGREIHPTNVQVQFTRLDTGRVAMTSTAADEHSLLLARGSYSVVVSRDNQTLLQHPELRVIGDAFDLFLTLDP